MAAMSPQNNVNVITVIVTLVVREQTVQKVNININFCTNCLPI